MSQREQLATQAARHLVPAIYSGRPWVEAGGLMSYAPSFEDMNRQAGVYVGHIINGTKVADLPVIQPTKFDQSARPCNPGSPSSARKRSDRINPPMSSLHRTCLLLAQSRHDGLRRTRPLSGVKRTSVCRRLGEAFSVDAALQ
jgi:hypothetical protein